MEILTPSTWPSSKPALARPFHGIQYNSRIYQPILQEQLHQVPTLLDINQCWRWRRTMSNFWMYRGYQRVVVRFSLFTVCFQLFHFFSSTWIIIILPSFCSLIHATHSATIRKLPNHIWKNSFFLSRYGCPRRVRFCTEWWICDLCCQCQGKFFFFGEFIAFEP